VSPRAPEEAGGAPPCGAVVRRPVIAMDGPGGAGKSTIARRVAELAGLTYVDTGAMYRAVAWAALRAGLAAEGRLLDAAGVAALAQRVDISFRPSGREQRVTVDGVDVTAELRTPEVERLVPRVAELPAVRQALLPQQRRLAAGGGVVMDGRDVGTAVLPDADFKFFITADPEVRVERRYRELLRRGERVSREAVAASLLERDRRDRERAEGPLRQAPDAVVVDTSHLTIEEAVERVLECCRLGDWAVRRDRSQAPCPGGERP
jgi:cytidylate kinase